MLMLMIASVSTTMTFDWAAIVTALAPVVTIIVTWYLQRRSTQHEANKVSAVTIATASKVAESVGAVHTLVNGKNDALLARVAELEAENRKLKGN